MYVAVLSVSVVRCVGSRHSCAGRCLIRRGHQAGRLMGAELQKISRKIHEVRQLGGPPIGGWSEPGIVFYTNSVRVLRARVSLCAVPLLMSLYAGASVVPMVRPDAVVSKRIVDTAPLDDATAMQASLRRDVAKHPEEFLVFVTETGANQFVAEHRQSVELETSSMIVARGVVGYWQGKTVVIVPWTTGNLKYGNLK
jgi:hypothetical protein